MVRKTFKPVANANLLQRDADSFHADNRRMGSAKVLLFKIELSLGRIRSNKYRRAPKEGAEIERQVTKMLAKGVIRKLRSLGVAQ